MILLRRTLLMLFSTAALSVGGFQAWNLHLQSEHVAGLEKQGNEWRQHISALQAQAKAARADADSADLSPPSLSVVSPVAPTGEGPFDAKISQLVRRVNLLKTRIAQDPNLQIAELRFVDDTDWFDAVEKNDPETEYGMKTAVRQLRSSAKGAFGDLLVWALRSYLIRSGDVLPTDPNQLAPFFATPVDKELLARYEILATGVATEVPQEFPVLGEKKTLRNDPAYEGSLLFSLEGSRSLPASPDSSSAGAEGGLVFSNLAVDTVGREAFYDAFSAFVTAHGGNQPQSLEQILPYLKSAFDRARFAKAIGTDSKP